MSTTTIIHLVKQRTRSWANNAQLIPVVNDNLWCFDLRATILSVISSSWQVFLEDCLKHYDFIALVDGASDGNSGGIGGII